MHAYFAKRVLLFIPTLIIVSFAAFFIVNILPGDPALFLLAGGEPGGEGGVDPVEYEKLRRELGTDRPFLVQHADWSWGVLRGELGSSLQTKNPVTNEMKRRFPMTLQLAVMAMLISMIVAVPLAFATGVTVTVRLAPEPPKTMSALATTPWSLDVPETVKLAGVVSTSPMVNAIGPVAVSSFVA